MPQPSLETDQMPVPLRIFATQQLLGAEQLSVLCQLETFFPEGLQDRHWSYDEPDTDVLNLRIDALMKTWRDKRPEQEPPAPVWKCDRNSITTHPQLLHLLTCHDQLWEEAIAHDLSLPQWVVAAWWWGCAAVVCNTSAEKLEFAIAGWQQRYRCAVLYLQSPEMKQDPKLVAEYQADLKYSSSAHIPQTVDLAWAAKDDFNWKHWQLPSALQPWGSRAQWGKEVMARPQA
ncbi:hypothetical protein C1752_06366 [Acaryochloris thomasi RCC1774]|uniref:Uncharacterized protein n=1 Tax=Acaryochloris thomasi RCC1774 TaxID=1764569 RepID=A0A2W1JIW0_9CYAN|nr:hypothetical protein [Acaryochloris thomasi]PZD71455.1 hypothetical protein C1752_06366 [Acaryochloris thomasi RCC1774]